jgi:hypothetical protein
MQSLETFQASDTLQSIDIEQKRALIISAAKAIHQMHLELGFPLVAANDPQRGNIVYDLATLLDDGVHDHIVALGLREAGTVMMTLCDLLTENGDME